MLFILAAGGEDADEPNEEVVKVFRAEKRLMAMDFLVRYPDYLADALLDLYNDTGEPELLEAVQHIILNDEPSVRLVRMVRWRHGAYQNVEDALAMLSYYGLARPMQLAGDDGKIRRYEYLISPKAISFLDQCVRDHPELAWYRDRLVLVMRVAAGKSGSALKELAVRAPGIRKHHPGRRDTDHPEAGRATSDQDRRIGTMSKERIIESTENGWTKAIAEDSASPESDVRSVLLKYGVRAQTTPPRAKSLRFDSIKLTGVRAESERDSPFDLSWSNLGTGIWAVMSERNLRGKSSILNLLYAAIRGDFPGRVKPDVWKWLETIDIRYCIDDVLHRLELRKAAGEEKAAEGRAKLSRSDGDGQWITLYEGDAGDGLKSQTEHLMMEELDFPVIYAHNKNTGGHPHGWPLIASTFFLSSSTEAKALFGDLPIDGLPLRLLQLFIGLPWVSTYSAALTAQKQVEQGLVDRPNHSGVTTVLNTRLLEVEGQLAEAKKARGMDNRGAKRLELERLDEETATNRKAAETARVAFETDTATVASVTASYDDARRRLKQLEDELSAGYSFRQLSPTCCPACEAAFEKAAPAVQHSDGNTCALCKNDLPVHEDDLDSDRIQDAQTLVEDLATSLQIAKAKLKASGKAARDATERLRTGMSRVRSVQEAISTLPADPELVVVQLEAQAQQLRELMATLQSPNDDDDTETQGELKILRAASEVSKTLMTSMQSDVLTEIADSVMSLAKKFGVSHVTSMHLDGGGKLRVRQGGADIYFSNLTMGEKLRIKIAISLAAVEVAKRRGHGRHPGLLIIDSPASEEVVNEDFEQMLDSVSSAAKDIGGVQIIIGTIARKAVEAVVSSDHRLHAKGEEYLF
ncbi:ATP-binding protein [Mesorhizobium sp. L48C026A00]|nr:ATP-binding protein [Mesorhizobium sp. L48C026A00]